MRKLSLLLAICLMLICFVACNNEPAGSEVPTTEGSNDTQTTTQASDVTETPTDDAATKVPETPQDKWTGRY